MTIEEPAEPNFPQSIILSNSSTASSLVEGKITPLLAANPDTLMTSREDIAAM